MRDRVLSSSPWAAVAALLAPVLLGGCALGWDTIDLAAVQAARQGIVDARFGESREREWADEEDLEPEREEGSLASVILGEVLAVFPGILVHGLGHNYAGDHRTATQLRNLGGFGYLMMALGGGLAVGGAALEDDVQGTAYVLYGAGGIAGVVGVSYFFSAWIYDLVDTPRAVRSGGRPPPRSTFLEALDVFE